MGNLPEIESILSINIPLKDNYRYHFIIQYLYFVHNKSTTFFYTLQYILYKGKEKVCEKQTSIKNRKK